MDRRAGLWKIFAWRGPLLAAALCIIDLFEPFVYSTASIRIVATEYVEPSPFMENGLNAVATRRDVVAKNDQVAAPLFGMDTEPVGMGELREKWRHVAAAMAQDLAAVLQCHSNGPCPVAAQRLIDISAEGTGRGDRARVGLINRAANLAISPVSDERQWGVPDHWSDPPLADNRLRRGHTAGRTYPLRNSI